MKKFDLKKFLQLNFPYFIIFYLVDKTVWLFRHCVGDTLFDRVTVLFNNYGMAFSKPLPSLHIYDLLAGVAAVLKKGFCRYNKRCSILLRSSYRSCFFSRKRRIYEVFSFDKCILLSDSYNRSYNCYRTRSVCNSGVMGK